MKKNYKIEKMEYNVIGHQTRLVSRHITYTKNCHNLLTQFKPKSIAIYRSLLYIPINSLSLACEFSFFITLMV